MGALAVLIPLSVVAYETYRYQTAAVCTNGDTGVRAQDMGSHNYFRGYWTAENWSNETARITVFYLNGTTGAPGDSLVYYVRGGATSAEIIYGDSLGVTNFDASDTVQVYCHGDRSVGRLGP